MKNKLIIAFVLFGVLLGGCTGSDILKPSPLYVRVSMIYDGEVGNLYFDKAVLDNCDTTFVGRSLILAHDSRNPDGVVGRIEKADIRRDEYGYYIEGIVRVIDRDAITKIFQEKYFHLSVGINEIRAVPFKPGVNRVISFEGTEISFVAAARFRHARVLEWSWDELELTKRGEY